MRGEALQRLGLVFVLAGASDQIAHAAADGYPDAGGGFILFGLAFGVVGTLVALDVDTWLWRKANEEPLE